MQPISALNLHPLLVTEVREERTPMATFDTKLFPSRPVSPDSLIDRCRTFEMWRISRNLRTEIHQSLHLCRSNYKHALARNFYLRQTRGPRTKGLTIRKVTHIHNSRADTHEQHTILPVLRIKLRYDDVQGSFRGGVDSAVADIEFVDQFEISMAAGDSDDFLDFALEDEREEEVEEVGVADDVGREGV